jgi:hypothetical protein
MEVRKYLGLIILGENVARMTANYSMKAHIRHSAKTRNVNLLVRLVESDLSRDRLGDQVGESTKYKMKF